jgi:hypothetical protein
LWLPCKKNPQITLIFAGSFLNTEQTEMDWTVSWDLIYFFEPNSFIYKSLRKMPVWFFAILDKKRYSE